MDIIRSKESKTFRLLLRLTRKKYRDKENAFLAEGPNIVSEALNDPAVNVKMTVFSETRAREDESGEDMHDTVVLSDMLFEKITDTEASQGVVALIEKPVRSISVPSGDVVVLDRLQDPGNIGTIIRTSESAGIACVYLIKGTCDPYSPKVVRACAGSILRVPLCTCSSEEVIAALKSAGKEIIVTDCENGVNMYDARIRMRKKNGRALVIGNEGSGVSDVFRKASDKLITIPMKGKLESLNAGVATAIALYEMERPEMI